MEKFQYIFSFKNLTVVHVFHFFVCGARISTINPRPKPQKENPKTSLFPHFPYIFCYCTKRIFNWHSLVYITSKKLIYVSWLHGIYSQFFFSCIQQRHSVDRSVLSPSNDYWNWWPKILLALGFFLSHCAYLDNNIKRDNHIYTFSFIFKYTYYNLVYCVLCILHGHLIWLHKMFKQFVFNTILSLYFFVQFFCYETASKCYMASYGMTLLPQTQMAREDKRVSWFLCVLNIKHWTDLFAYFPCLLHFASVPVCSISQSLYILLAVKNHSAYVSI